MKTYPSVASDFITLLKESHLRLVGVPLIPHTEHASNSACWLYEASFCVLAHNTESDPCIIYANKAAQRCFGYTWDEFTALRSRLTAEFPDREKRQQLLDLVNLKGFIKNYSGQRITKSGQRFWIENGTIWNLTDRSGILRGQAATFEKWWALS
ncbi:MAG: MEKHLA domain-containing protein [Candidatus Nitrosoglobus sp.]|jgi:PAS domain-containing protein